MDKQLVLHHFVRKVTKASEFPKTTQFQPNEPVGFNRRQVHSASLNKEDILILSYDVFHLEFDRRISSTVKDQALICPDEPRRVETKDQFFRIRRKLPDE